MRPKSCKKRPYLLTRGVLKLYSVYPILNQSSCSIQYVEGDHSGSDAQLAISCANALDRSHQSRGLSFTGLFYIPGENLRSSTRGCGRNCQLCLSAPLILSPGQE